eukprot:287058-Pyramimonas_sp.AAC.1
MHHTCVLPPQTGTCTPVRHGGLDVRGPPHARRTWTGRSTAARAPKRVPDPLAPARTPARKS